jgi:hypothetical protein
MTYRRTFREWLDDARHDWRRHGLLRRFLGNAYGFAVPIIVGTIIGAMIAAGAAHWAFGP